jgi:hypothetical protein
MDGKTIMLLQHAALRAMHAPRMRSRE